MNTDYLIQFIILVQPVFWEQLLYSRVYFGRCLRYGVYVAGSVVLFVLLRTGWGYAFYVNYLLILYVGMVMVAISAYSGRFSAKDSVCLGFLTVFLNSFYWEMPLHLADVLSNGVYPEMLVQYWRLYPVLYLGKHYVFKWRYVKVGLYTSIIVMLLRFMVLRAYLARELYLVNRVICLACLILTILEAVPREQEHTQVEAPRLQAP